jgi:hypothetical protein
MPEVLVDTNLMLLLAVGSTNRSYIAKHKRLQAYSAEDFDQLLAFVNGFSRLICCPNIWSEVSNFVRYIAHPLSDEIAGTLTRLIERAEETYVSTRQAAARPEYRRLGISDAAMLQIAQSGGVLLTDDLPVYIAACSARYEAVNFNHLREARYGV